MAQFRGKVARKTVAAGSKSERPAIVLEADGRSLVLRRLNGNPFHDDALEALVGKSICAEGNVLAGYTLVMSDWKEEKA